MNKNNTLIIFDWDDTIFPTNWTINNGLNINDSSSIDRHITYFQDLDNTVFQLLQKLSQRGKIIIVTNAVASWVYSCCELLPKTKKIINNTKVISARNLYQTKTNDIQHWKILAFKNEINNHNSVINVISIGDAEYEYNALINLDKMKKKDILKLLDLLKIQHMTILLIN